jgi:YkoY family integral membrane protein
MIGDLPLLLRDAVPAIALLVVLEGLLSVDNMLAIASLANRLPADRRKSALRLGLIGAYVFRALALVGAAFIAGNRVVLLFGSAYLLYLAADHFKNLDESDRHGPDAPALEKRTFWGTVVAIQFLDLSLSLDNVVVAVGVAPDQMWIVYTGVFLGLVTLWLFSTLSLKLIEKYPVLNHAAFLLIAFIGVLLLLEAGWRWHIPRWVKFVGSTVILGISFLYSRSPTLQKLAKPLWRVLKVPMGAYAAVTRLLVWPFRKLVSLWK